MTRTIVTLRAPTTGTTGTQGPFKIFVSHIHEETALAIAVSDVWRARIGMVLSGLLLIPALATLWAAWHKLVVGAPPPPAVPLSLTGAGA